jgi:hypothetical protein
MLVDLDYPWLPMAYPPETVRYDAVPLRYEADVTTVMASGGWRAGAEYSVSSRAVDPSPAELNAVTMRQMASVPWYREDTSLPDDVPRTIHELALALTRDADTPYQKVYAIQRYLTAGNGFAYATDADTRSDTNALVDFLTVSKHGFCQQFATAMTVLVREIGIPARVAVGFRSGTQEGHTFTVTSRDAHSWVEVYFPAFGWLPFEPTPSRPNPLEFVPGSYLNPDAGACLAGAERCEAAGTEKHPGSRLASGAGRHLIARERAYRHGGRIPEVAPVDTGYSVPYGTLLRALLALIAAFLVLTPIVKVLRRRRMLRRAREPRELVLAAYRAFEDGVAELGLGREGGETLSEHRDRLARAVRLSDGHLRRLTIAATDAAYSDRPIADEEAREAVKAARVTLHDIRKDAGFLRKLAGTYRLRTWQRI